MDNQKQNAAIANLLFPDLDRTPEDFFRQYAPRDLPEDAVVTRFAPSPTGFIHLGSIYIALVGRRLAQQSGGVFILRIEDTDQQREVKRGVEQIVKSLHDFGIVPDEGPFAVDPLRERGDYGPYRQSERRAIYAVFAHRLVETGAAYPSFQTAEELEAIRQEQQRTGNPPGYYGPWAKDRGLTLDEIQGLLDQGSPFVIRCRAPYPSHEIIRVHDAIRGVLEMPENQRDYVLLKSDGLPTYHLAHAVDDSLMRVTLALRADEWLSTLPLHVQLFHALEQPPPTYAHIAPIGKTAGASKRKLSKRKDPEAKIAFYHQQGYPRQAILEYVLNIANSSFEDWRRANPSLPLDDFPIQLERMSSSIALFDFQKLDSISKDVIARYGPDEIYTAVLDWARQFDPPLARAVSADPDFSQRVFSFNAAIGNNQAPRKDLSKWLDVRPAYGFFFDDIYTQVTAGGYDLPELLPEDVIALASHAQGQFNPLPPKEDWLAGLRELSNRLGYAPDRGTFKKNPGQYKGMFGDVMMGLRIALTNQRFTPDLHEILQTLGPEHTNRRLDSVAAWAQSQAQN